jgi:oligo-1,6-glucosidase
MVLNHTSDEHPWFIDSRSSRSSARRDWYHWADPSSDGGPPNRWASFFGGSAWQREGDQYYLHLFDRKQPDLNWDNPEVRREIVETLRWWAERGVDGFRLDVINLISKVPGYPEGEAVPSSPYTSGFRRFADGPRVHEYLSELSREVYRPYGCMTVGEMPGVSVETAQLYSERDRNELDMVFQFELMDVDSSPRGKWDIRPAGAAAVSAVMKRWQEGLATRGWNSLYWNNHDQPRVVSRFGSDRGEERRLSAKMLAALLYLQRGTAFVYQGEELGMTNVPWKSKDELRDVESLNFLASPYEGMDGETAWRAVLAKGRDNARSPFCWNAEANAGFSKGSPWIAVHPDYHSINAEAERADGDSIFHFYRRLIRLRREEPALAEGRIEFIDGPSGCGGADGCGDFVFYRRFIPATAGKDGATPGASAGGAALVVGVRFSATGADVGSWRPELIDASAKPLLANYPNVTNSRFWRPWEVRVWREK